ncbi:MAG: GFA family protein [Kangiellaceae bacterium]|nr:GFA family protein [Kangiellaceae bacterium]
MSIVNSACEGGCACGFVRYQVTSDPLITHCCHCRYCQRQTGSAFVINALLDAIQVKLLTGSVDVIMTPSPSGSGQNIARCPNCRVAVWSNYSMGGIKELIRFVRVGTLDNPDQFPPDVHIYTSTKQPWVILPENAAVFEAFYNWDKIWSKKSNDHRKLLLAKAVGG